jgi:ferredoxin
LKIDIDNCKGCGICERACKSNCIDNDNKQIDFTRCVSCYNCVDVCPGEGIKYFSLFRWSSIRPDNKFPLDRKRRTFISKILIYISGLAGLSYSQIKTQITKESTKPVYSSTAVAPPGSISIEHFTGSCTACHLCISSCPTQVLQPSFLEYGILGIFQPRMDFHKSFCNYECNICGDICPTGAIKIFPLEDKKLIQTGIAKFVKENCIVHTQRTDCGACSEHCPTKAVHMIPDQKLFIPEVCDEYCIGCGACEHACPTKPYKAIYVDGNEVHKKVQINESEKVQPLIDTQEDFPF